MKTVKLLVKMGYYPKPKYFIEFDIKPPFKERETLVFTNQYEFTSADKAIEFLNERGIFNAKLVIE